MAVFHSLVAEVVVIEGFSDIIINASEVGIQDFVILSSCLLTLLDNCAHCALKMLAVFYIFASVR